MTAEPIIEQGEYPGIPPSALSGRENDMGPQVVGGPISAPGAVVGQLCAFDYYSGIPDDHECEWLRGRSTVEFAVPRASEGGPPAWVMADHYVIIPVTSAALGAELVRRLAGQRTLFEATA